MLLVEGEPGIGKTALLAAAADAAAAVGMDVLRARGGELEQEFGFGLVRHLFERPAAARPDVFAGQARFAARVLGVELAGAPAGEPFFPALHGLYWMVRRLAADQPLGLFVDDAQWADRSSARFLAYLAARLGDLPVLVVVATRDGEAADALRHGLGNPPVLRPGRLSPTATSELVRGLAPGADDDACQACHAATGGNAFFVREVAGALRAGERIEPAQSPEGVTRVVAGRIAALDPGTREAARACAILGDAAAPHAVAALAGLGDAEARAAVDALRAGGILAPAAEVTFRHPIVRAAVESSMPPGLRAGAHARAARLEAAAGAARERVAAHLLAADAAGDPWASERLAEAGREALSRGAPEAAARYLERALAEPPPEPDRARVLLDLATAETFGFRRGAIKRVRQAFDAAADPAVRLEAALLHAHLGLQGGRGPEALDPLARVLAESRPDSDRALMVEGFTANFTRTQLSARQAAQPVVDRLRVRTDVGADADPNVLIAIAAELSMAGTDAPRSVALARAALERLELVPPLARAFSVLTATRTLIMADDHEFARLVLEDAMETTRARGAVFDFTYHAVSHANLSFRAGAIQASEADARSAYAVARDEGWPLGLPSIAHYLVQALVERGELEEAWAILRETGRDGPPEALSDMYTTNLLLFSRARLRLAGGDPAGALGDLRELGRRQVAFGEPNPSISPWRSLSALAQHALGETDAAGRLAAEEVALARAWGAPRALGVALRAAGVVGGDLAALREAVTVLDGSYARLEHAWALAELGRALRHERQIVEAREPLRAALEIATEAGAAPLAELARAELHSAGARPRRTERSGPDALTASERRAAELAAGGRSNPEIAGAMVISRKTVEKHLSAAYRKLGVTRREELDGALAGAAKE